MADLEFKLESETQDLSFTMDETVTMGDLEEAVNKAEEYRDEAKSSVNGARSAQVRAENAASNAKKSAEQAYQYESQAYTYYNQLKDSVEKIDDINQTLVDLKMLGWSVPEQMSVKNSVSGNQFVQKVSRVRVKDKEWLYQTNYDRVVQKDDGNLPRTSAMYCNGFVVSITQQGDLSFSISKNGFTSLEDFYSKASNEFIYYELAQPITYTIDGNEAISKINDSLEAQGLLEKYDGIMIQGRINIIDGQPIPADNAIYSNIYSCNANDKVVIEYGNTLEEINIVFFNNGTLQSDKYICSKTNKVMFVVPSGCNQFRFDVRSSSALTPSSAGKISVSINNAIDEIKADLNGFGSDMTISSDVIQAIESSFTSANNFSLFSGSTQIGNEYGWYGFKNSIYKPCYITLYTGNEGVLIGKRDVQGNWKFKKVMSF